MISKKEILEMSRKDLMLYCKKNYTNNFDYDSYSLPWDSEINFVTKHESCILCTECTNCKYCLECTECQHCVNCEHCTVSIACKECNSIETCTRCHSCNDSRLLYACYDCDWCNYCVFCTSCSYCYLCSSLEDKKFHILNVEFTENEYFDKIASMIIKEKEDKIC